MREGLFSDPEALAALCRRYRIRRLSLFGSTLKSAARPESDVDLLVDFEPGARPSLLTMAEIERALSSLLQRTEGGFAHRAGSEPLFSRGRRARRRAAI